MNPQILQLLMSNPQILASLMEQQRQQGQFQLPQQFQQPAPQPAPQQPWQTAEYYGPEAGREQYFKNMGVDTNPVPVATAPPPAPMQSGGYGSHPSFNPYGSGSGRTGFGSPFGQSMLQINPQVNQQRRNRPLYPAQVTSTPPVPQADPNTGGANNPFGSQNPFGAPASSATPAYRRR